MEIKVSSVTKVFRQSPVVENLSFKVKPGQILGLLGPNGAGKTTTLRMILNILQPDRGTITFDNKRMNRHIRHRTGYLPEERGLYQKYRVLDVIVYIGRLKNLSKRKSHIEAVRLLDNFQMIDYVDEPIGHLSKGMQQKLQFVVALVHNPDILLLDEPMAGLDPINQELMKNKLTDLRDEGKTILLSTHQLSEAEELCDYFVVINQGRVILQGSLDQIRKNFYQNMIIVETQGDVKLLRDITSVRQLEIHNSEIHLYLDDRAPIKKIMSDIINRLDVQRIETHKPSLNDIFIQTVKNKVK